MPSLLITAKLKEDGADRRENGLLSNHQCLADTSPNHRSLVCLPTMPAWQRQGRDGWKQKAVPEYLLAKGKTNGWTKHTLFVYPEITSQ